MLKGMKPLKDSMNLISDPNVFSCFFLAVILKMKDEKTQNLKERLHYNNCTVTMQLEIKPFFKRLI